MKMGLSLMGKCGNSRNLALKGIEEKIDDSKDEDESEDEDEDDDKDEDLTFILMRLSGFFNIGKMIKTNLLGNLNSLGRVRKRNRLSSAMSTKVLVI